MSAVKYFITQNARKLAVDEFLARELNSAGYGGVEIRKMPMKTEVVIHASRPGVVIGRRGAKIRELTEILETEFGIENAQIEVSEIESRILTYLEGHKKAYISDIVKDLKIAPEKVIGILKKLREKGKVMECE